MSERTWSGGCQCGAVRYELSVRPDNSCICHCRMCQKQFGSFFGAFAGSPRDNFKVTRGKLAHFQSSDDAERGFCCDCGTPLTYEARSRPRVEVAIGSFDRHSDLMPEFQYRREAMEPWLKQVFDLPCTLTGEGDNGVGDTPERYAKIAKSNRQHPDHDTNDWRKR